MLRQFHLFFRPISRPYATGSQYHIELQKKLSKQLYSFKDIREKLEALPVARTLVQEEQNKFVRQIEDASKEGLEKLFDKIEEGNVLLSNIDSDERLLSSMKQEKISEMLRTLSAIRSECGDKKVVIHAVPPLMLP